MSSNKLIPNIITINERLVTKKEAAELLGISDGTLDVWNCTHRYNLPYIKVGRLVKYRYSDLIAFIESRTQNRIEG